MSNQRKYFPFLSMASLTAFFGLVAFNGVASNPRFATIHTLDVMRLMIAGASIAVTIALLALFFTREPRSDHSRAEERHGEESN